MLETMIAILLASAAPHPAKAEGLRIGSLALCRDSVASVSEHLEGPDAVLHIALAAGREKQLERLTAGRVGKKLPIRLDGRIISAPLIREPLTGGRIAISGAGLPFAAIAAAARAPC